MKSSLRIPDLDQKVFLITGASTGIGAAVARALAMQGASVAVHYNASQEGARDVAASIDAVSGKSFLVGGDVSVRSGCEAVVAEAADHFGRLDGSSITPAAFSGGFRRSSRTSSTIGP